MENSVSVAKKSEEESYDISFYIETPHGNVEYACLITNKGLLNQAKSELGQWMIPELAECIIKMLIQRAYEDKICFYENLKQKLVIGYSMTEDRQFTRKISLKDYLSIMFE